MKSMKVTEFITENDQLVVEGRGDLVRLNIKRFLAETELKRHELADIGKLCRRVGLVETCLKLLHSVIYPDSSLSQPASENEKLQYAAALIATGAFEEPEDILSKIDAAQDPEVLLYRAIARFTRWKYREAISFLEEFVDRPELSDYQRLMGKINLCSALLTVGDCEASIYLCDEIIEVTDRQGLSLLNCFALEVKAEALIWLQQIGESRDCLDLAAALLKKSGNASSLWGRKWKAVGLLLENKKGAGLRALKTVARDAKMQRDWETLRECTLISGVFTSNEQEVSQVYYGTPYDHYRKRALKLIRFAKGDESSLLTNSLLLGSTLKGESPPVEMDLVNLKVGAQSLPIKCASSDHRLLGFLILDVFRPLPATQLHEMLYPGEYYNPFSSKHRLDEAIRRLRRKIESSGAFIPVCCHSQYKLNFLKPVLVKANDFLRQSSDPYDLYANLLRTHFTDRRFSSKDVAKVLSCSQRKAQRVLAELRRLGKWPSAEAA